MDIQKGGTYRLASPSPYRRNYFIRKYGTVTPEYRVECEDLEAWGKPALDVQGNPACMLYAISGFDLPEEGRCFYGHIGSMGEVVHESELQEMAE